MLQIHTVLGLIGGGFSQPTATGMATSQSVHFIILVDYLHGPSIQQDKLISIAINTVDAIYIRDIGAHLL